MTETDRIDEHDLEILLRASQIAAGSGKEHLQKHLNQFKKELEKDKCEDINLATSAFSRYSEHLRQNGHNVVVWGDLSDLRQNGWEFAMRWVRHKLMRDMVERSMINDDHFARNFAYSNEEAMAVDREGNYLVVIEGEWNVVSLDDKEIWEPGPEVQLQLPLRIISEGY